MQGHAAVMTTVSGPQSISAARCLGTHDVPQARVAHQVSFLRFALYARPIRPKTPQNKPPVHI
eukprot:4914885-Prymnesium_polylepis.1